VNAPQQQEEEDCGCTDGFCPHHHHKAPATKKADEEDCTCRLSADNQPSISSSASVPAILPDPAPPLQTVSAQTLRFTECDASAWDEMPATPPPRA
jgi:hypothetical protein